MAWLYFPGSAESISPSRSQSAMGIELCVTLSGTLTPRPDSWRGWKTRPWRRLLSGMMCEPSTAQRGVESWISLPRAIRVSRSRSLVRSNDSTTSVTSGQKSAASLMSADQLSFFSKTHTKPPLRKPLRISNLLGSRSLWERFGPPTWVQDIIGGGYSPLLPTLTTKTDRYSKSNKIVPQGVLPTMTARGYGSNIGGAAGREGLVRRNLKRILLATVTVKGNYNRAGLSERAGDGIATQLGGKPNPRWIEWYMGFPIGWLMLSPYSVDRWSHYKQQLRSAYLRIVSG